MPEISFLQYITIVSLLLAILAFNRGTHWKAKYEEIDKDTSCDGWRSEALFLRQLVNKEAAEAAEEHW